MFARHYFNLALVSLALALSLPTTGCLNNPLLPETQQTAKTWEPGTIQPCSPSPDLVPNGKIDASDWTLFGVLERKQDLSADFTQNGIVDEFDRRVLQFMMGKPYTHECRSLFSLPEGCYIYASPDINRNGYIDAPDVAAFSASGGNPSMADFNGDRVVDELDKIILEERLGQPYTVAHYANVDMDGDGMVTASDFAIFESVGGHLSADFTHNGVVNDYDRRVLSFMLGRTHERVCGETPPYVIAGDCIEFASTDINGNGWVDAPDIALFYSGALTLDQADFNGDGVIDTLDEIILLDSLGTENHMPRCDEVS